MYALFLILGLFSLGLLVQRLEVKSRRTVLLGTFVCWGVALTAITEFLSALHHIDRKSIVLAWVAVSSAAILYAWRRQGETGSRYSSATPPPFTWLERILVAAICAVAAYTLVLALIAPPNTWDSMTYHMSRVVHWIQNKNVSFYPTAILRQLHSNPWSEYAILHLQLLTGGDRYANLIQWCASVGSIIGVSSIARHLGANRFGQILAAVFCATLPMGILQSTSTQTDYVAAFWLVCFIEFSFVFWARPTVIYGSIAGAALGLAILTKGTAYIYAAPFVAALAALCVLKDRNFKKLFVVCVLGVVAITINSTHYFRNYSQYGKALGPGTEGGAFVYNNKSFDIGVSASNAMRNAGLHLGFGGPTDAIVESTVYGLHGLMGLTVNSPDTTWPTTEFHVAAPVHNEDISGNPFHFVLIIVLLVAIAVSWRKHCKAALYGALVIIGFLIFCTALKWQPWHSRLHLPLFVLCAPLVGLALGRFRHHIFAAAVACLLIAAAVPTVLSSVQKPTIGPHSVFATQRTTQYFRVHEAMLAPYSNATNEIRSRGCAYVGIVLGLNDWEYPFWTLLAAEGGKGVRIRHIGVSNASSNAVGESVSDRFAPCMIVSTIPKPPSQLSVDGRSYDKYWNENNVSLYRPTSAWKGPFEKVPATTD